MLKVKLLNISEVNKLYLKMSNMCRCADIAVWPHEKRLSWVANDLSWCRYPWLYSECLFCQCLQVCFLLQMYWLQGKKVCMFKVCELWNRVLFFRFLHACFFQSSAGLLMKSLDRDMFDAEPMKELSGRRPLLSTDFQGQKVVLKVGYSTEWSFDLL